METLIEFPVRQPVAIFLIVLGIILLAPLFFNKLKIPNIVGMIIAGVIVGPYGFNILERDASFEIFGQVGILYLMFLAAVEIDMYNLRRNARGGIVFGLITFALPMSIGLPVVRYCLDTGWLSAALIASMFASHTLISYPIINRFGLQNTRSVVIAVCGTIVSVLLSLVVLAEVVSTKVNGGFGWQSVIRLTVSVILYAVAIGWSFPLITRWFFRKFSDQVTQFIYVLAMVFVASLLAQLIGLEAILGAFYAGLILNRFIPMRSGLMNRIAFVGNAIFIPYFLIGVGMLINVHVVFNGWMVVFSSVVMTLTALASKWGAAFITQKIYGFTSDGRYILFGLTSGKAAATIAAVMVGYKYDLITEDLMNGAVLMILVCCAVASIVTERGAIRRRIRITGEDLKVRNRGNVKYGRQLVAVSNPITAEGIMKLAILMRSSRNENPIAALFVRSNDDSARKAVGDNALRAAVDTAVSADIKAEAIDRYDINIVSGITNVMKERDCTEIIIGLHRKSNIVDTFYGSLIEQMLRETNRMIVMSRCFIPVNTVRNIYVLVPGKAEYETGFKMWVARVSQLSTQIGARMTFYSNKTTANYISGFISTRDYRPRYDFKDMQNWDDFIMLSRDIEEDDLLIVIGARRGSISFSSDLEHLPGFLSRYYTRQNLVVIYPEQFGDYVEMPTPIDPLAQPSPGTASPFVVWTRKIKAIFMERRLKRLWHRHNDR